MVLNQPSFSGSICSQSDCKGGHTTVCHYVRETCLTLRPILELGEGMDIEITSSTSES